MKTSRPSPLRLSVVAFCALAALAPAFAFTPREQQAAQAAQPASKEFVRRELHLSSSNLGIQEGLSRLADSEAWNRFLAEQGGDAEAYIDPRSGTPSSIVLRVPIIPGSGVGNHLTNADLEESLGESLRAIDSGVVASAVRAFVDRHLDVLRIDPAQLGAARAAQVSEDLWQVSFPQQVDGVPVRHGRLLATISHGNLVLLGTETWGNARVDTIPTLDAGEAIKTTEAYWGAKDGDTIWRAPALEILPIAPPRFEVGEEFAGPIGQGYEHRLVWSFGLARPGALGAYEALVDAHTGELLAFQDKNSYLAETIAGGVYPISNTGICPSSDRCGVMQPGYPMPFADTGFSAPNDFTNSAGVYAHSSGAVATSLNGRFVKIVDTCGGVNEQSATGTLDLGGVNGDHDCVSGGASAGNTPASRTAFNELNKLREQAVGWLPSNGWLHGQLTANVNIDSTCNAFYSSNGQVTFFKSGGGCRNTGEIAAVFDHEWGHALDDNDAAGELSSSSETYADINAIYRLQNPCLGYGFLWTSNRGCGATSDGTGFNANNARLGAPDCELDCSGVRGMDWDRHADHTPDTPASFVCPRCTDGEGPCGREVHCDNHPAGEAAWDFATRDLRAAPYAYDAQTAFILASRTFYQGSGSIGGWWTCSCPTLSNGCAAGNAYMQWLAADDDNGNLGDGTPHMTALFNAFNRHGIACATPAVQDSGCAGGPTIAPNLTLAIGNDAISLQWTAVPGAAKYWVMRSEGYLGCNVGKARIATVTGTGYTDTQVANDHPYNYMVLAQGTTEACAGPGSACMTATPQRCAGLVSLDSSIYSCGGTVTITLQDADLIGLGMPSVDVFSGTEPTHETVSLAETPPGSGIFTGTIATTGAPASHGDGALSVVDGDTITVRYTDASYCGTPNVVVNTTAAADCRAPGISNVHAASVTGTTAKIAWNTDEPADQAVVYDLVVPPLAGTASSGTLSTVHALSLSGLAPCATYHYAVTSVDPYGNAKLDDNGGAYYAFTTYAAGATLATTNATVVSIPDNTPSGASSTITLADSRIVEDVNVAATIAHSLDSQLVLTLIAPNGSAATLSNQHGAGPAFTDTLFDDEASTSIASGASPFTSAFRPDTPLAAVEETSAAGTWRLNVADLVATRLGTLRSWTIYVTSYESCTPHAASLSGGLVQDSCALGGPGGHDGTQDPGETVQLRIGLQNDGPVPLTGVTAALAPLTAGVTMIDASASFPDLPAGGGALSLAPDFTTKLPTGIACGSAVDYQVNITSAQGSWSGTVHTVVGRPAPGPAIAESFGAGIPGTWTVVNGGTGGGAAATWTSANPGSRPLAAPLAAPAAIVDSGAAGAGAMQDEQLVSPTLDLSGAVSATLAFDQAFHWVSGGLDERGDVDVRSSLTGGAWVTVLRNRGSSSPDPDHRTLDLTALAAGGTSVQVRFHYYGGNNAGWWAIDNVALTTGSLAGCTMTPCAAAPHPVPDGTFGTAMTALRSNAAGTSVAVHWDATTCPTAGYHLLYGPLAAVSAHTVSGGACGIGTSGSFPWAGVPAGNLWFVVVSDDGAGFEGSWGTDGAGAPLGGSTPSGQCGITARSNSGTCP